MKLPIRSLALATAMLCTIVLTGCTLESNSALAPPVTMSIGTIQGKALGGNLPIVGATIQLYAAGTGGYGTASTALISTGTAKYYPGGAKTCVATADAATSYSITSNVLTVTFTNPATAALGQVIAGQSVTLSGFTTGTYLNGQTVVVTTVSATQFTATFTHADVATQADLGTVTSVCNTSVVTDQTGSFNISSDYTCTSGQQIYMYSSGGNPGLTPSTTNNSAAGLLAVLGTCSSISSSTFVVINEVSTVAAAYALAGFATDATHISDDEGVNGNTTASLAQTGMANAFANAANLETLGTGVALAVPPASSTATAPQSQVNTVADILVACVNTTSSASANCSTLLTTATSDGTPTGVNPTDTATAAINIAHHPAANVATLYGLVTGNTVFTPSAGTQPADFTMSILYPQGGTGTVGIAIDGLGNMFAGYGGGSLVYKITPAGVITSVATGSVGQPRHLAVDASNNVWTPLTSSSVTTGTIVEYSNSLGVTQSCNALDTTVTPTNVPVYSLNAIAIAPNGNIWAEGAKSTVAGQAIELTTACAAVTSISTLPKATTDIAINANGYIAIPSTTSGSYLSILNSSGAPITNSPFAVAGLAAPSGVIADASGNFWVADSAGGVSVVSQAGAAVSTTAYPTGSLSILDGDFDGLGNYFIGSSSTATTPGTIYELNSSGTLVATFTPPTNTNSFDAVDPSGNLWYGGNKYIAEMIGVGAPKVTPIVTATTTGKLATRP